MGVSEIAYATIMSVVCLVGLVGNTRILCCARNLFTNRIHVFYTKTIALVNISATLTGVLTVVLSFISWNFGHILCFVYLLSMNVALTLPPYLIALYNVYTAKHLGTLDATDAGAPASRYREWVPCLLLTVASAIIWTIVILLLNEPYGMGYEYSCFFFISNTYGQLAKFIVELLLLHLIPLILSLIFYRKASTGLKSLVDDEQSNYEQDSQLLRFNKAINLVYFSLLSAAWILYFTILVIPTYLPILGYALTILNLSFPLFFVVLHACFNPAKTS